MSEGAKTYWTRFAFGVFMTLFVNHIIGKAQADTSGVYCEPQTPRTSIEGTRCNHWLWDSESQKLIESKTLVTTPMEGANTNEK